MEQCRSDFAFLDKQFRTVLDSLTTGVLIHDCDLKIAFCNQAALDYFGMKEHQLRGKLATDLPVTWIGEDHLELPFNEYPAKRAIDSGQPVKNQIIGCIKQDATDPMWMQCQACPEMDEQGNLSQIVVSLTNFSREKKLLDLNFLFETALDQSPAGIAIVEAPSGKLIYLNQAGFIMRGGGRPGQSVKNVDLNGLRAFWNLRRLDGVRLANDEVPLMRAIHHGEETSAEFLLQGPNQTDRIMWTNVAPVSRSDGAIIAGIAVFLDTTDFHNLKDQLKIAEMKSHFLDVAAHELRSPITAFSLLLQFTQKQYAKGHVIDKSILDRLGSQVDRISQLINGLLDVTRLQHGTVKLSLETKDLVSLVSDCIADYKLRAPDRTFKLSKPDDAIKANFDSVRIYQVLSNFLDNAIKYTGPKTPVEISVEEKGDFVRVSVKDYGPGIRKEEQSFLFLPFSRGTTGQAGNIGGLGLGLSICRGIIELHGGTIRVISEPGAGCTFFFEIPRSSKTLFD